MPTTSQAPDVLLIMCDQLSANVLSCYGGPVTTPNLDRLADESVRFTNATCPSPFCTPSRASLLTGLYPHAHGIVYNVMDHRRPVARGRLRHPPLRQMAPAGRKPGLTDSDFNSRHAFKPGRQPSFCQHTTRLSARQTRLQSPTLNPGGDPTPR